MSWGTAPSFQQRQRTSWRGSRRAGLPDVISSGGMPSLPGAFPFERASTALSSYSIFGLASSSSMIGRGGIELRAA